MSNQGFDRIKNAQGKWNKTFGEYFLRLAGLVFAISAIYMGYFYSKNPQHEIQREISYSIKRPDIPLLKNILLVSASSQNNEHANIIALQEAIYSYYGTKVSAIGINQYQSGLLKKHDGILLFGNSEFIDKKQLKNLIKDITFNKLPLMWIGTGFSAYAEESDIKYESISPLQESLNITAIKYNGTEISAAGLKLALGKYNGLQDDQVVANYRLDNTVQIPAIIKLENMIYISFVPFTENEYTLSLAVVIDSLSHILGKHKKNPRVIFRLEDVNAETYGGTDTSFRKTADYLEKKKVFTHVAIIPTMMDEEGKLIANIDSAMHVINFIKQNQQLATVIQHGSRHHRIDPRNKGKKSGDAFEYFLSDDDTLGRESAYAFALERMTEGYQILANAGIKPEIFEAPHYTLSPGEQEAASKIYPVMHHQPLFYANKKMELVLPWFTEREDAIFAPSSIGYIDALNKNSVNEILHRMENFSRIMPDPIVVVFFHPFMIEIPGRENDLKALVEGVRKLKYRFVNTLDEVKEKSKGAE